MPADGDLLSDRDFEIQHTRDRVELLLHARHGATGPSVEAITARLRGSATASIDSVVIARALATHARSPQVPLLTTMGYPHVPPSAVPPCAIVVSLDRLAAFVVPVQAAAVPEVPDVPADDVADAGDGHSVEADATPEPAADPVPVLLTAAELRRRLAEAGVVRGLLDAVIDVCADGVPLDEIRRVARGQQAVPGVDARLEYHIESDAPGAPLGAGSGSIDLHALSAHRFVTERTPLVMRRPPVAGVPGFDVCGTVIEPPAVRDADLRQVAGANTEVDGETLVAAITGRRSSTRGAPWMCSRCLRSRATSTSTWATSSSRAT